MMPCTGGVFSNSACRAVGSLGLGLRRQQSVARDDSDHLASAPSTTGMPEM